MKKKPDLESSVNGLSEGDTGPFHVNGDDDTVGQDSTGPFMFDCVHREYDHVMDAHKYFVTPVIEYDDLDFEGHDVCINGVVRKCSKFEITDNGHLIIHVNCLG